jgi:NAD(P)-dependent dehydrogenase (short-subunit alcohol dehydrogenase family)
MVGATGKRAGLRTFAGGVALVTGGASGIGAALGRELARRGARVVLADREGDDARAEAGRIGAAGGRAEGATLDVRDAAAVSELVADVFSRHGRLRHLLDGATHKALWEKVRPMDGDRFPRRALDDVARNRAVIVHPAWWRVLRFLDGVAPSLVDVLARRELARIRTLLGR